MMRTTKKNKGQIWIETVLYTLIGLVLIGVTLAIVMPKINAARDRILVEQTASSMGVIDEKISEILDKGPGNIRVISEFSIKEGRLIIYPANDTLTFVLSGLSRPYSEPGFPVKIGKNTVLTERVQSDILVYITLDYRNITNITYAGIDSQEKIFSATSLPYIFSIENLGGAQGELPSVDITENIRGAG